MRRQPLEESLGPNATSPFAGLKEDSVGSWDSISRARSFTEGATMSTLREDEYENQDTMASAATALHASFDAALLDNEQKEKDSIFRTVKRGRGFTKTASWDGHEVASAEAADISRRKHSRPTASGDGDVVAPGTVRKQPRRGVTRKHETKKTPGRRYRAAGSAMKKSSPASQGRRRRQQRPSPKPGNNGVPPTPPSFKLSEAAPQSSPATSNRMRPPPQTMTPTRTTHGIPQSVVKHSKTPLVCHTGTTVNSSLETAASHEPFSPSMTPFHFTSFPASLPRVNNPRTAERGSVASSERYPQSMRKRPGAEDLDLSVKPQDRTQNLFLNPNPDVDGEHDSFQSSCSSDIVHVETAVSSLPQAAPGLRVSSSMHTRLFEDDDHCGYVHAEDDSLQSPSGSHDTRTRLDFNMLLNPSAGANEHMDHQALSGGRMNHDRDSGRMDLSRPYEQQRTSSFPSSVSSQTLLRDLSGCDEATVASTSALTPSRSASGSVRLFAGFDDRPQSPVEVQFPFRLDAQCSPIPGVPEEDVHQGHLRSGDAAHAASSAVVGMDIDTDLQRAPVLNRIRESRPPLIPSSSPRKRSQREAVRRHSSVDGEDEESSRLSLSQESEDSGSSTNSKTRRLRPMPDMSGFDAGISLPSSSTVHERTTDESTATSENRNPPSLPKLVCPPTPVRTPAWAHTESGSHSKFARSNSLIATKVLATCPVQVLDGHSSLESSLLEDDDEPDAFAPRFSTLDEGVEDDSPMKDLSEIHETLTGEVVPPITTLKRHSSAPVTGLPAPLPPMTTSSCSPRVPISRTPMFKTTMEAPRTPAPPTNSRLSGNFGEVGSVISFVNDFENLGKLGSGAFADVFKVRSRLDQRLYAVKRNRRQFRGKRDREMALAEVRIMQRLQSICAQTSSHAGGGKVKAKSSYSLYVLFFFQAWQEEGYFFCQTELCCRDTCRELIQSLRSDWPSASKKYPCLLRHLSDQTGDETGSDSDSLGRLLPEATVWKICHDTTAGLSHIHSHGIVHHDIKPSNIFLVSHSRFGAMCKIGDFGMAGDIGSSEDGQEGDTVYMAPELLSSDAKHPSADMFSLGLSLYELASFVTFEMPSEGARWLELRRGSHTLDLPKSRSKELSQLIQSLIHPVSDFRPTADDILDKVQKVKEAETRCESFLKEYIFEVEEYDLAEEQRLALEKLEADERGQTPRNANTAKKRIPRDESRTPTSGDLPETPFFFTPED